jgi:DNA-binding MarR family transcriptional regulator
MSSGLADELKMTRPFRTLEEEVTLSIVRTAAVLEHAFAQALKPYDITPTQYNVLRILKGAGTDGLCRNEVGARLLRPVPDVTRLLDRMEELQLISRRRGGEDRRYVTTYIAPKGLEVIEKLDEKICAIHREHLGHVGKAHLQELVGLLTRVREKA